jgi:hypothetical protein
MFFGLSSQFGVFNSNRALIDDAVEKIKESLAHKTGHPFCVTCTYELSGKRAVKASTKVHYTNYRKHPDLFQEQYVEPNVINISEIVEVVYRPSDKNCLYVITKDPESLEHRSSKSIEIDVI